MFENIPWNLEEEKRAAHAFLHSEYRKQYSKTRVKNDGEDIRAVAAEGLQYMRENGAEFLQMLVKESTD